MATQFEIDDRSVVEFQLGNKQLLLLFLGLLVVCAIFFFIGLRVGEDTARSKAAIVTSEGVEEQGGKEIQKVSNEKSRGTSALAVQTKPRAASSAPARSNVSTKDAAKKTTETPAIKEVSKPAASTRKPVVKETTASASGYYVQVAAPTNESQAEKLANQLSAKYPALIQKATVNDRLHYRVRVGPFPSKEKAEEVKSSLLSSFPTAFLAKS